MVAVNTGRPGILNKIGTYLEVASALGEAYQRLPPKPRPLDWLALAAAAGNAWATWAKDQRETAYLSPTNFFTDPGCTWEDLPQSAWAVIKGNVENATAVVDYWNGEEGGYLMVEGTVGGLPFRWVQEGTASERLVVRPHVPQGRRAEALTMLTERFWARQPGRHVAMGGAELEADGSFNDDHQVTTEIRSLIDRCARFLDRGVTRSMLLVGLPGAGKSTAIRATVAALRLTSLRLSAGNLKTARSNYGQEGGLVNLTGIVQMARPDVLIVDDVDHMMLDAFTLSFFENVRAHCRLVLTSCNSTRSLLGAALRPGRFDDIVEFATVDPTLIARLSHGDPAVAERLAKLPVAYAHSFYDVARVLGVEQATVELDELEERAAAIERAGQRPSMADLMMGTDDEDEDCDEDDD
jgi:hypothetical protein